jgi:hypothetical protein
MDLRIDVSLQGQERRLPFSHDEFSIKEAKEAWKQGHGAEAFLPRQLHHSGRSVARHQ